MVLGLIFGISNPLVVYTIWVAKLDKTNPSNRFHHQQYSVADELMKWGKLKEEGHISEDEFNQAKAKLLKGTEKND